MKRIALTNRYWLVALALTAAIWAAPARAQSPSTVPQDRDSDMTRQQLATFDQFLDNHPELSDQIRKNPSLVNNEEFVENHPALQQYLQQHPEVRTDLQQNPGAVMNQEQRYDKREDRDRDSDHDRDRDRNRPDNDVTRGELLNLDRFLSSHPEIAEQIRKDPSLVDNQKFVSSHPAFEQFLAQHPGVREEYRENPTAFMRDEERFQRNTDITRGELVNMDRFLDSHPELAEQIRKNPSLVNNDQFVKDHPALQQFLAEHPGVQTQIEQNPNAFMHQEQAYDRREDAGTKRYDRDNDVTRGELSSFHEFLEGHGNIASELEKNPSLAGNEEYLENHSALQTYLQGHPQVREELNENPRTFIKSARDFDARTPKTMPKLPGTDQKLK